MVLCSWACACASPKVHPDEGAAPGGGPSFCVKGSESELSPTLASKLAAAADVLSFEAAWRGEHPAATSGSVSHPQVVGVIRSHGSEIRGCYEAALARLPDNSRGKVVVRFVIDASGRVPAAALAANELHVPEVACCLAERVSQWTFPAPSEGDFVVVEYPFSVQVSKS